MLQFAGQSSPLLALPSSQVSKGTQVPRERNRVLLTQSLRGIVAAAAIDLAVAAEWVALRERRAAGGRREAIGTGGAEIGHARDAVGEVGHRADVGRGCVGPAHDVDAPGTVTAGHVKMVAICSAVRPVQARGDGRLQRRPRRVDGGGGGSRRDMIRAAPARYLRTSPGRCAWRRRTSRRRFRLRSCTLRASRRCRCSRRGLRRRGYSDRSPPRRRGTGTTVAGVDRGNQREATAGLTLDLHALDLAAVLVLRCRRDRSSCRRYTSRPGGCRS